LSTTADVEVTIDGVVIDPTDYTLNRPDGSIKFNTAPGVGTVVGASYTTLLPDAVAQATGLIATDLIGQSRIAARGLIGLQSIKVAEVAITALHPTRANTATRNGVTIPASAAAFLDSFALGSAA
jgi:hypothetical protein